MEYSVKLTPSAIAQIQETIGYISKVLLVPAEDRDFRYYRIDRK